MLAPHVCPACLSLSTCNYSGGEFMGCYTCGTIFAKNRHTTAVYDAAYVANRYERYPTTRPMSLLRYDVMVNALSLHGALEQGQKEVKPGILLDVGYGNGDFIRVCCERGWDAFGNDVNPTEYPGVRSVSLPSHTERYDVITFFDTLEHFETLVDVRWLSHRTDWIVVSFPTVPDDFPYNKDWKHYRPGEHHLQFQPESLVKIFGHNEVNAALVYCGSPEDTIRGKRPDGGSNITTCVLRCSRA
jgi:Methyltransferase domain